MGQKEDIGQLFEKKLNHAKKIANPSLWEKISASLDEENRRKKRMLFYWLMGGGISVLFGLLVLFGNKSFNNSSSPSNQDSIPKLEQSKRFSENDNSANSVEILEENSRIGNEEKLSGILLSEEIKDTNKIKNPLNKNITKQSTASNRNSRKNNPHPKSADENFTVTKNYYYYNSKNGKQLVTKNKEEIDSLISKQNQTVDSTASKKENKTIE